MSIGSVEFSEDDPQLGDADVDRAAVVEAGVPIAQLLEEIGVGRIDGASVEDAPVSGWRVLRRHPAGQLLIGAPIDRDRTAWRVAHVKTGSADATVRVHPEIMRLRPSRAERRRGLELRWPVLMAGASGADGFAIDVVNTGTTRWTSDGDAFHVVGTFTAPGVTNFHVGWVSSGQSRAVPLDPGEYARVNVSINPGVWSQVEPGRHELHAVLVGLGLPCPAPLEVDLSAQVIEHHRQQHRRHATTPEARRRARDEQLNRVRAQLAAGESLEQVTRAVATAKSDDEAVAAIGALLDLPAEVATDAIYHSSLRELRPANAGRRLREVEQNSAQHE